MTVSKLKLSKKSIVLSLNPPSDAKAGEKKENKVAKLKEKKPAAPKVPKVSKVLRKPPILTYKVYGKILSYFQEKYPKCFTVPVTPLAVGIHKELMNETDLTNLSISKRQLKVFFRFYCSKSEYIEALKLGAERLDLNGNQASLVTEKELQRSK